ncbi:MAG: acyl carrier protein [Candidatus Latescibacteria bacterium]|nr:acyl carrier protein [Candidatus Latescibacterota bacterium]
MEEIRTKVREFVLKYVRDDDLGDNENMFELGYVNSLFAMQLVLFVEKEFGITVNRSDLDFKNFRSIEAITSLVARGKGML